MDEENLFSATETYFWEEGVFQGLDTCIVNIPTQPPTMAPASAATGFAGMASLLNSISVGFTMMMMMMMTN
jgi:hypothetical protein